MQWFGSLDKNHRSEPWEHSALLADNQPLATRAGLHICYPAYYSNVESVHTNPLAGLTNYKDEVGSRLRASYRARSGCI